MHESRWRFIAVVISVGAIGLAAINVAAMNRAAMKVDTNKQGA